MILYVIKNILMLSDASKGDLPPKSSWDIHVLYPYGHINEIERLSGIEGFYVEETNGVKLCTEWTPQSVLKLTNHINNIGVNSITPHKITICNYETIINNIPNNNQHTIIFNLCDGNEHTGWIGKSAFTLLDNLKFAYTGSSPNIYKIDEVKTKMKKYLISVGASTPNYINITGVDDRVDILNKISKLKMPVLIKPANLSGSIGLTNKNVCHSSQDALTIAVQVSNTYGPVYIEEYISGKEFTVLCFGSADYGIKVLTPLERVFRKDMLDTEKFLSYQTKWIDWKDTWWYAPATSDIIEQVKKVAIDTYKKAKLDGYCRYDMRQDKETGVIYIVDVNLNCSMDVDDESALQIILKHDNIQMFELLEDFFWFALFRKYKKKIL